MQGKRFIERKADRGGIGVTTFPCELLENRSIVYLCLTDRSFVLSHTLGAKTLTQHIVPSCSVWVGTVPAKRSLSPVSCSTTMVTILVLGLVSVFIFFAGIRSRPV